LGTLDTKVTTTDHQFMAYALAQARQAATEEEVPVGAVVVYQGRVIGAGRNAKERQRDPTAHAEMIALREAAHHLNRWRLENCTVYVTLEPCPMCIGAMVSARVERLVFGCADPKSGAAVSLYRLADDSRLNHRILVEGGLQADEGARLLQEFFQRRRDI
jgi:tRNA(adenine34) deaminase